MIVPLVAYKTLVFDCDGVILNSNKVKTEAFYQAALPYGADAAQKLVEYHVSNGGVSRYKKFTHFLEEIVPTYANQTEGDCLDVLLKNYANKVAEGLLVCEVAEGLVELREKTSMAKWLIVSGGDQSELRWLFARRGLDKLFDGGIFGSPDSKDEILECELKNNIVGPALFLGDSKYDYQASSAAGLDFVFLSDWSEVTNWKEWCARNYIAHHNNISSIG